MKATNNLKVKILNTENNKIQLIQCMNKFLHSLQITESIKIKIKHIYCKKIDNLFKIKKTCKNCMFDDKKICIKINSNFCFKQYKQNILINKLLVSNSKDIFISFFCKKNNVCPPKKL